MQDHCQCATIECATIECDETSREQSERRQINGIDDDRRIQNGDLAFGMGNGRRIEIRLGKDLVGRQPRLAAAYGGL